MAGKAPLLLASVLFIVGAVGLALTSAERAEWGPFEPHVQAPPEQSVAILSSDISFVNPMPFEGPLIVEPEAPMVELPAAGFVAAVEPVPEPEVEAAGTPALVPLRVFGLSSDTGGVAAATVPPPPLRAVNIAADDAASEAGEQPPPEPETPEPSESATPEPEPETSEPEPTQEPESEPAPEE